MFSTIVSVSNLNMILSYWFEKCGWLNVPFLSFLKKVREFYVMNFHDCDVYDFVRARVDELRISYRDFYENTQTHCYSLFSSILNFWGQKKSNQRQMSVAPC